MPDKKDEKPEITIESLQEQMKSDAATQADTLTQMSSMQDELNKFKAKHAEQEKIVKKKEREARQAKENAAKESGDIDALTASWTEKYQTLEQSYNDLKSRDAKIINSITVEAEARAMSLDIALDGSADVIRPHIETRLVMELIDDKPVIKVLKDGRPSALTLSDLRDEISNNKAFAPIIRGSSASGGGSAGTKSTNGGKTITRNVFEAMNPLQRHKHISTGGAVVD